MRDQSLSLLSLGLGLAEHDEVIGVSHEAKAVLIELPVQVVEDGVGQQRTDDAPLGSAHRSRLKDAVLHYTRAKEFLDEVENVAVSDLSRDCLLDDGMREFVEERFDVGIENDSIALIVELQDSLQSHVTVTS